MAQLETTTATLFLTHIGLPLPHELRWIEVPHRLDTQDGTPKSQVLCVLGETLYPLDRTWPMTHQQTLWRQPNGSIWIASQNYPADDPDRVCIVKAPIF